MKKKGNRETKSRGFTAVTDPSDSADDVWENRAWDTFALLQFRAGNKNNLVLS